jgi:hypothetical protein
VKLKSFLAALILSIAIPLTALADCDGQTQNPGAVCEQSSEGQTQNPGVASSLPIELLTFIMSLIP